MGPCMTTPASSSPASPVSFASGSPPRCTGRACPARVAAWTAPGEPVPFAEARRAGVPPVRRRRGVGTAVGHGVVPRHRFGARAVGGTRSCVVDLGFTGAGPGFQAEGTVYAPDGVVARRHRAARAGPFRLDGRAPSTSTSRRPPTPTSTGGWGWAPTPLGDLATAGDDPLYHLGAVELADLDTAVWGLLQDIWTLSGLVEALPGDLPRRAEVLRALERAVDAVDPDDVAATAAAGRAELADVLGRPAYASAHRVYAVGHAHIDSAWLWPVRETVRKVHPHVRQRAAADGRPTTSWSSRRRRPSSTRGCATTSPSSSPASASAPPRAGSCRSAACGWSPTPTCPAARRWPASSCTARASSASELGVESDGRVAARLVRLLRRAAPDRRRGRAALAAHPEDQLERHQPLPAPHVRLGGHRRHPHPHALPAGRHLQRRAVGRRAGPCAAAVRGEGAGQHVAGAVRLGRRRRRAHPGDAGRRAPHARPGGLADRAPRPVRRSSSPPRPPSTRTRRCGRASCTSSTTAAPTPRSRARSAATGAASTCCARPSCGPPPRPSGRAREYPAETLRRCWETVLLQQFHDILPGTSIAWVHRQAEREYARVADELEGVIADALTLLVGPGDRELAANAAPYARRRGARASGVADQRVRRWRTTRCASSSTSAG